MMYEIKGYCMTTTLMSLWYQFAQVQILAGLDEGSLSTLGLQQLEMIR